MKKLQKTFILIDFPQKLKLGKTSGILISLSSPRLQRFVLLIKKPKEQLLLNNGLVGILCILLEKEC